MSKLAAVLTSAYGVRWREETIFLLDGAAYHKSEETRKSLQHLGMQVVLSAPYSYQGAPAELWFGHLKQSDWNEEGIKTGKT